MTKLNLTPAEAAKEIKTVKQCNKVAREKRAVKRGFKTSAEYLTALTNVVNGTVAPEKVTSSKPAKKKVASKVGVRPVIFVFDVLDRSGSMGSGNNSKIAIANQGINSGLIKLREEESKLGVDYKHLLVTFDGTVELGEVVPVASAKPINIKSRGLTALNDAIVASIDRALTVKSKDDKVLINVYTDGGENASGTSTERVKARIEACEKDGIVITFIGTTFDTATAIRIYSIHDSNTMSYDGTAKGMGQTMQSTNSARSAFSKKVVAGEDVSNGFYKKIVK